MGYEFARYIQNNAGNLDLLIPGANYLTFFQGNTAIAKLNYAANATTLEGGGVTGDDFYLKANSIDVRPKITLLGGAGISVDCSTGSGYIFAVNGTNYGGMGYTGGGDFLILSYDNKDIQFTPNGTGKVRFGTYTGGAATDSTGYITILDNGGATRKLMVQA